MDPRKLGFPEQILAPRRRLVPGLGLGITICFIVLTIFLLYPSNSLSNSLFIYYNRRFSHHSLNVQPIDVNQINQSRNGTLSVESKNVTFKKPLNNRTSSNGAVFVESKNVTQKQTLNNRTSSNATTTERNGTVSIESKNVTQKQTLDNRTYSNAATERNGTVSVESKNANRTSSNATTEGNGTLSVESKNVNRTSSNATTERNGIVSDESKNVNRTSSSATTEGNGTVSVESKNLNRTSSNATTEGNGTVSVESKNVNRTSSNATTERNGTVSVESKNVGEKQTVDNHPSSNGTTKGNEIRNKTEPAATLDYGFDDECDIYDGRWVRDDSKPYYPPGSCPYIDRDFDCFLNKRPEDAYVKWKWQPNNCNIPSLNATHFLEMLRGRSLVFVGDSLNRNMWESLLCILRHSVPNKDRVYEISGRTEFKKEGFYAFRFEDYNCSIDFVSSTFLVKKSSFIRKNGTIETLRLDQMDPTTKMYRDSDVLIFNTGHWWTHEKTSRGEDYYQEGNHVHPRLKVLEAFKRALTTWGQWIDNNVDRNRTLVFFRGYSYSHFSGGQWNSGGQCDGETEPIYNETHLGKYPKKMRALEYVMQSMKTPVSYINITRLTHYRKDAHPSIYRMEYKTEEERRASIGVQDCSHWCLPGVPDTWNELLYVSLLRMAKKVWSN